MNFLKKKSKSTADETENVPVKNEFETRSLEENLSSLTNKNSDYLHAVQKQLSLFGKNQEEINHILEEILPQILIAQKNGMTARALIGTPTEFVSSYKPKLGEKPKKETNKDPRLIILDSFLLLFALLGALFGVTMEFQKTTVAYGLTTLILSSAVGALGMYAVYRQQLKISQRGKVKLSIWERSKPTLQLVAFMVAWMAVMTFSAFLPKAINPLLDGISLLILAAAVFGVRYFLKRRYNIQSAIVSRLAPPTDSKQ